MANLLPCGFPRHINLLSGTCCSPDSQATENQTCSWDLHIHAVPECTEVGMVVWAGQAQCIQEHTSCTERISGMGCSSPTKTAFSMVNLTDSVNWTSHYSKTKCCCWITSKHISIIKQLHWHAHCPSSPADSDPSFSILWTVTTAHPSEQLLSFNALLWFSVILSVLWQWWMGGSRACDVACKRSWTSNPERGHPSKKDVSKKAVKINSASPCPHWAIPPPPPADVCKCD